MNKHLHIFICSITLITGLGIIVAALALPPAGEIHNSVLVAYGESLTFIGSILGVDYHYRYRK